MALITKSLLRAAMILLQLVGPERSDHVLNAINALDGANGEGAPQEVALDQWLALCQAAADRADARGFDRGVASAPVSEPVKPRLTLTLRDTPAKPASSARAAPRSGHKGKIWAGTDPAEFRSMKGLRAPDSVIEYLAGQLMAGVLQADLCRKHNIKATTWKRVSDRWTAMRVAAIEARHAPRATAKGGPQPPAMPDWAVS